MKPESGGSLKEGDLAVAVRDAEVYRQPDEPRVIGTLKQGAVVTVGPGPFMGRVFFTIVRGAGPAEGCVPHNCLAKHTVAIP
ncbi:MAG: hypothetical protein HC915_09875 [Anaerolineae bacterium]|nr:hypothetical protein [Anaerolineae bacterium]